MPPSSWPTWFRSAMRLAAAPVGVARLAALGGGEGLHGVTSDAGRLQAITNTQNEGNTVQHKATSQGSTVKSKATWHQYKRQLARTAHTGTSMFTHSGQTARPESTRPTSVPARSLTAYKALVLKALDAKARTQAGLSTEGRQASERGPSHDLTGIETSAGGSKVKTAAGNSHRNRRSRVNSRTNASQKGHHLTCPPR